MSLSFELDQYQTIQNKNSQKHFYAKKKLITSVNFKIWISIKNLLNNLAQVLSLYCVKRLCMPRSINQRLSLDNVGIICDNIP